jgi:cell division septation protein DedD
VLEVAEDRAEGAFDNLIFPDDEVWPPPRPAKPEDEDGDDEDAEPVEYPIPPPPVNSVPSAALAGVGAPTGWTSFGPADSTSFERGELTINGGDDTTGWYADMPDIDVSVPQWLRFAADVSVSAQAGPVPLVALVRYDPQRRKVYGHTVVPLDGNRQDVEMLLDGVERLPSRGSARLSVMTPAGCSDQVVFSKPSLVAEPHLPSVQAARRDFGIFDDPAKISLFVKVPNALDQVTEMVTHLKIQDAAGTALKYEKRKMACGARAVALFPVSAKLKKSGLYHLHMRVQTSDGSRDLVNGLYPFIVAPADPEKPKNAHIAATISGTDSEQIHALATAGVGWVSATLDYPEGGQAPRLRAHARDMAGAATTARRYGVDYAVIIKLASTTLPAPEEFQQFFDTVDGELGRSVAAYLLDAPAGAFADDEGARGLLALAEIAKARSSDDSAILLPAGVAERGRPVDTPDQPDQPDGVETKIIDSPGDTDREPTDAGHDCAQPGFEPEPEIPVVPIPDDQPTDPPPAVPATPATTAPTPEETAAAVDTPHAPAAPYERPTTFEVFQPGPNTLDGTWLVDLGAMDDADGAARVRAAILAMADGHGLLTWDTADAGRVLDDEQNANAAWLALWNMASALRGSASSSVVDTPEGVAAIRATGPSNDIIVVWSEARRAEVDLSGNLTGCMCTDMYGTEQEMQMTMGRAKLTLTPEPTYISVSTGAEVEIVEAL